MTRGREQSGEIAALRAAVAKERHKTEELRELIHSMAAAPGSRDLLHVVCEVAARQCRAAGVAVCRLVGDEAEVVAGAGVCASYRGFRLPLKGTVTGRAVEQGAPVTERDLADHATPPELALQRAKPDVLIGPFVVIPLIAHGELLGTLVFVRDVGAPTFSPDEEERIRVIADHASIALKKARLLEEAQTANQAKSNFLATISHELRTPLTALTGYSELLVDEILGPMLPEQREVIDRMRTVTNHLGLMIDEILTFSSIEAGREKARLAEVSPAAIVESAAAVLEPLAGKKGIDFRVLLPEAPMRMVTDADKVRQILVNLGGNAIKFTEEGEVRLALEDASPDVRFQVQDTGIGLAPEEIRRLFQPFSQIETGLTRRHGGTGLGLYISRKLAELLGGTIEVDSRPGAGSRFTLVLPSD